MKTSQSCYLSFLTQKRLWQTGISLLLTIVVLTGLPHTGLFAFLWWLGLFGCLTYLFTLLLKKVYKSPWARPLLVTAILLISFFNAYQTTRPLEQTTTWQQLSPLSTQEAANTFTMHPIATDGEGGLWFGYKDRTFGEGLGHFNRSSIDEAEWHIYPAPTPENQPGSRYILSLLPDGKNGVWVGTLHGGIGYFDAHTAELRQIPGFDGDVLAMLADGNNLWLATFGDGVMRYDLSTQTWTAFTTETTSGGLQDNQINELIADGNGGLWAGTYHGGVSHYEPKTGRWQAYTAVSTNGGLASNDVRALMIDKENTLWVGTFGGGVSRFIPKTDTWILYNSQTTNGGLASNYALTLLPGENGNLWAGLSNLQGGGGLAHFDSTEWHTHTVTSTDGRLPCNDIRTLAADGLGGVWAGTHRGISHVTADRQTWTTFTTDSTHGELPDNSILTLLPDDVDTLWVGMGKGLTLVNWIIP